MVSNNSNDVHLRLSLLLNLKKKGGRPQMKGKRTTATVLIVIPKIYQVSIYQVSYPSKLLFSGQTVSLSVTYEVF